MSGTNKASKVLGGKYMRHGYTVTQQNRTEKKEAIIMFKNFTRQQDFPHVYGEMLRPRIEQDTQCGLTIT